MSELVTAVLVPASLAPFPGGAVGDLAALADVKLELQLTDASNDAWLAAVISRVSDAIAAFCNRTFQVQTYQDQFWATRDPLPRVVTGGFRPLQLSNWPVAAPVSPAGIAPPLAPVLSAVPGGALAAAVYYVRITYVAAAGETAASLESRFAVPANNLLQIAAPALDQAALATGWNAYVSPASFTETLQNPAPVAIGAAFTLPSSGLISGIAPPSYVTVVENAPPPVSPVNLPASARAAQTLVATPVPLAEGVDFIVDSAKGQITRLALDGYGRAWPALPLIVQYPAGYVGIPMSLQEAVIRLVKMRWFARNRDPMLREENIEGIYEAQYWFGTGPGAPADFPTDIGTMLERDYRIPVIA